MDYARERELPQAPVPADGVAGRSRLRSLDVWIIGLIVVLDQATKLAVRELVPLYEKVHVVPGLLDLTHVQNTGAAFGILNASDFRFKGLMMTIIAAVALVAIAMYAAQLATHERIARTGLVLILGGALGNLVDRALFGHVVDFVDVYWGAAHFWAFNVADASITVGAALVILEMLGLGRHASRSV